MGCKLLSKWKHANKEVALREQALDSAVAGDVWESDEAKQAWLMMVKAVNVNTARRRETMRPSSLSKGGGSGGGRGVVAVVLEPMGPDARGELKHRLCGCVRVRRQGGQRARSGRWSVG